MQKGYLKNSEGGNYMAADKVRSFDMQNKLQVFGEERKIKYDELKEAFMNTGPRKNYCKKRIDQKGTRHDLISILKRSGSECL